MLLQTHEIDTINEILSKAQGDNRTVLFEHEVYDMLDCIGLQTPKYIFVENESEVNNELISQFAGKMVVKIVSRDLAHKQKYGGVKMLETSESLYVRYVMSGMINEIYSHFSDGEKPTIDGFVIVEFVSFKQGLGYELMFGAREDAAFGPVLTLSKGGDDAEFFAKYYDPANLYLSPLSARVAGRHQTLLKYR